MGLEVHVPIPEPLGSWGGTCGQYYGVAVHCYDTNRPRLGGSDDPYSKYYKYYPAEGAIVKATFYNERWSKTVSCMIPTNQPKGETVAWCYAGTTIPCTVCGDKGDTYISIDISVTYKGYTWKKSYPNALHIFCPKPGKPSPYIVKIAADDCKISGNTVCADFWLEECSATSFPNVHIGLYTSDDGNTFTLINSKILTLYHSKTKVCFPLPSAKYVGISVVKPGTFTADKSWVCAKEWTIKL